MELQEFEKAIENKRLEWNEMNLGFYIQTGYIVYIFLSPLCLAR